MVRNTSKSDATGKGRIRIIGGKWRGRMLTVLQQPGLRPTPDRVRETLFNWLQDSIQNKNCLDVFAGSGGYPPVDATPIANILPGLQIVNFRVRLQEFLGAVLGIIVNHREGKGKGHLQAVEEVGQALHILEGVVVDRHKCDVIGQDGTPLLTNQGPAAPR